MSLSLRFAVALPSEATKVEGKLQLERAFALIPEGKVVSSAFYSRHGFQQETVIKVAWAHLMNVYFECNSVIFRLVTFEHHGGSLISRPVEGSEHKIELSPGLVLENV